MAVAPSTSQSTAAGETAAPAQSPQAAARTIADAHERRRIAWLNERAGRLAHGTRVLDLGFEVAAHRDVFANCQYNFFDLRAFLASARDPERRGRYRVPVADAAFDVIVCTNVFEWALQPTWALEEIARVLVPEGTLWVAPPLFTAPDDAPPRASGPLSFAWFAANCARLGLEIGDAFGVAGLFGELSALCVEAGERLDEAPEPTQRAQLEQMLLSDLPLLFADLEAKILLETARSNVILEAKHRSTGARESSDASPARPGPVAERSVRARIGKRPLRVTYLITSILGVTGGNMTLLHQVDALRRRGHEVTIVTRTPRPTWTDVAASVIQVGRDEPMAPRVPPSDAVIATYFQNAVELPQVGAPVKIYYAQGDQFVFEDDAPFPNKEAERARQALKAQSRESYLLPGVHFVANSRNLAEAVRRAHGVAAESVLPVCTDETIFRPLARAAAGSRQRILVVGPDTKGSGVESLVFKGIGDIRKALEMLRARFDNFTAVRISNTAPEIFRDFPCEYHVVPSDELKTFLFGTADILVYASHFDSCPRPPQEAMAAGAAVVCTETGGAKEYCVHEQNCLLVPIKDPRAISEAVIRLVKDPKLRQQLIEGGKRTAAEYPREREYDELEVLLYRYAEAAGIL